ncbi:cupin domain-containing protein [Lentzea sp. NPDC059081]|uniref:cupin domain-containing protein n=1 Tax=Lentzea sp. NPDC059081 TaxID=3346719 RepID=UPI003683FC6C
MEFISSTDLQEIPPLPEQYHEHFTGTTDLRELGVGAPEGEASVLLVRFEPGARNAWHRHTGGQLIYVTEGEGYVQSRGQDPVVVRAGDAVACPPDEEHWHGATPGGPGMTHLAVTYGKIVWLEPHEQA